MAEYKDLGLALDLNNWEQLNENFNQVGSDFEAQTQRIDGIVEEVTVTLKDQIIDDSKINWLTPVSDFPALEVTYPNAQVGDAAQTLNDDKVYRYDGTEWIYIQEFGAGPVTALTNKVGRAWVDVKDFGAVGDGVTDDTQAIRNALASVGQGGTVFFPTPSVHYKVALPAGETNIFTLSTRNVKIEGTAINGVYLPIIRASGTTLNNSASVFKIMTDAVIFENMSVFGGPNNDPKVGFGISTDTTFRPFLTFKNTHVLHVSKKAFDLTTYMCTMENCHARFIRNASLDGTGFDIKSEVNGLEGTMLSMIGCFTDYTDIGYKLTNMLYSKISACGADHVNEVSYLLDQCKNVSFSGIGSEFVTKQIIRLLTCVNVEFSAVKVVIDPSRDNSKYLMTLSGCTNCSVKKVQVSSLVTNFVEFVYGTLNQVEVPRITSAAATYLRTWEYTPDFKLQIIPVSSYDYFDEITSTEFYNLIANSDSGTPLNNKQILRHIYLDRNYKFNLTTPTTYTAQTQAAEKRLAGTQGQGALFFKGKDANKNNNLVDVGTVSSFVIENNKVEIIFENLTFYSFYQGSTMFTIKNSTVRFRNCVIRTIGSDPTYRALNIFNLENSKVVIEETTQLLGSSDNFFANKDNNSSIEFIKPTGTLPKNYEYLIENPTVAGQLKKTVSETCFNVELRKGSTAYALNDVAVIGESLYRATTAGTSASGTVTEASTINDGTVVWKFISVRPFKVALAGVTLTTSDYVMIDGKGLFRCTTAGTIDTLLDVSPSLTIGQTVDISSNGVRARKVAMDGLLTV